MSTPRRTLLAMVTAVAAFLLAEACTRTVDLSEPGPDGSIGDDGGPIEDAFTDDDGFPVGDGGGLDADGQPFDANDAGDDGGVSDAGGPLPDA